jgi:hypothetical protein
MNHASDDGDNESEPKDEDNDARPLPKLRRNRVPSYGHLKGQDGDGSLLTTTQPDEFKGGKHQAYVILQSIILTQYNLKQGIKKFGNHGKAAVLVELQQLHDRHVMKPVGKYDLTAEEQKGALATVPHVSKGKKMWNNKRSWMCRWPITTRLHDEARNVISNNRH